MTQPAATFYLHECRRPDCAVTFACKLTAAEYRDASCGCATLCPAHRADARAEDRAFTAWWSAMDGGVAFVVKLCRLRDQNEYVNRAHDAFRAGWDAAQAAQGAS